jgi:hypothetical protein
MISSRTVRKLAVLKVMGKDMQVAVTVTGMVMLLQPAEIAWLSTRGEHDS